MVNSILEQIVSFENSSFEKNSTGIDEASDDLNNIQNDHLKHGPGRQYKDLLIADLVH
jgi:hypothetical protein